MAGGARSSADDRRRVRLYFLDLRPWLAVGVLFLGVLLGDLWVGKILLTAGLVWAGAAVLLAVVRPADADLDALLAGDLQSMVGEALRRFQLADLGMQYGTPFAMLGPAPAVAGSARIRRLRLGRDRRARAPVNFVTIVVPMEQRLGIYSCEHDSLTGWTGRVVVEEHQYSEVASLRLEETVQASGAPEVSPQSAAGTAGVATQVFSLDFTNGRRLSVPVTMAWQGSSRSAGGAATLTDLEKTVVAVQALMRDSR